MYKNIFNRSRAFTLIELLVVILIIAILVAVALPNFLGQQDKANNSATVQQLTVVRKSLKASYINPERQYPNTTALVIAELENSEPQLQFVDEDASGAVPTADIITVKRQSDDQVRACMKSKSDTFFCLQTNEDGVGATIASTGLFGNDAAHAADPTVATSTGDTAAAAISNLTIVPGGNGWDPAPAADATTPTNDPIEPDTSDDIVAGGSYQSELLLLGRTINEANWVSVGTDNLSDIYANITDKNKAAILDYYPDMGSSLFAWSAVPTYKLQICPDTADNTFLPVDACTDKYSITRQPGGEVCSHSKADFLIPDGDITRAPLDQIHEIWKYTGDGVSTVQKTLRVKATGTVAGKSITLYSRARVFDSTDITDPYRCLTGGGGGGDAS